MATTRAQQQQAKHEPRGHSRIPRSASGNSLTVGTSTQSSLAYWSHSKDEENELDDAGGFIVNGGGRYGDPDDYEIGSQSSLTDSLYYSEDEGHHSQVTGVVSFASSRERDASFSTTNTSGADRYFDEPNDNDAASLGGDSSYSSNANVYIFTDDDSLSPRDHRLASASNESRLLVFRGSSIMAADEWLNPPSLLETPAHVRSNISPDISPLMSPGLDTPSGIVSPSSWQLYNQRKGKHVARKILLEQQQQHQAATAPSRRDQEQRSRSAELSSSSSASSPSRPSLWRRVTTRSSWTTGRSDAHQPGTTTLPEEARRETHNSNVLHQGRLSLVGSWEEDDEDDEVDDDGDEAESIHVVNCRRGGSGWDARADSRDIVDLLDLGEDGHQVLDEIDAALAGGNFGSDTDAVHMPPFPSSTTSIPFWPIFHGTMWLPRYDLYVEQALRSSPAIVAA